MGSHTVSKLLAEGTKIRRPGHPTATRTSRFFKRSFGEQASGHASNPHARATIVHLCARPRGPGRLHTCVSCDYGNAERLMTHGTLTLGAVAVSTAGPCGETSPALWGTDSSACSTPPTSPPLDRGRRPLRRATGRDSALTTPGAGPSTGRGRKQSRATVTWAGADVWGVLFSLKASQAQTEGQRRSRHPLQLGTALTQPAQHRNRETLQRGSQTSTTANEGCAC